MFEVLIEENPYISESVFTRHIEMLTEVAAVAVICFWKPLLMMSEESSVFVTNFKEEK